MYLYTNLSKQENFREPPRLMLLVIVANTATLGLQALVATPSIPLGVWIWRRDGYRAGPPQSGGALKGCMRL